MRFDRAAARSLYFSHVQGRLRNDQRRAVAQALVLVSPATRQALEDAHVLSVEPFPWKREEAAVDELRKALEITSGIRRGGTPAAA